MELDTPSGYIPSSITGITTGRIDWVIVQYQIHKDEDKVTVTFRNVGSSARTANVNISISFLKCGSHSISHTNWTTLLQGGACYNKDGNTVTVQVYNCTAYGNRERVVGTLPEGFRPTKAIEGSSTIGAMNDVAAAGHLAFLQVELDGTVTLGRLAGTDTNAAVTGQVSFVV